MSAPEWDWAPEEAHDGTPGRVPVGERVMFRRADGFSFVSRIPPEALAHSDWNWSLWIWEGLPAPAMACRVVAFRRARPRLQEWLDRLVEAGELEDVAGGLSVEVAP